ncbi:hypothetical protein HanPSC8_Chr11g0489561 [Helianthus annuus]|nr:hypothetical protein HanPSC8_Chr11g0489561 [Helianthus annuus]
MEVGSIGFGVRFDMGPVGEFLEMVLSLRIRFFSIVVSLFKLKGKNGWIGHQYVFLARKVGWIGHQYVFLARKVRWMTEQHVALHLLRSI